MLELKQNLPTINGGLVLVMGNGPSSKLVNFDLLDLNGIASVGMNAAYRFWDRIDFRPTYYICMDSVLILSHADRIAELIQEGRIERFFLRNELLDRYPEFSGHPRISWFNQARAVSGSLFDTDWITTGSWAIRWMAQEGWRNIAIIGIDVNYVELIDQAERMGAGKDLRLSMRETPKFNPNYFFPDYQQAGDKFNIPNDPDYLSKTGSLVHVDSLKKARHDIDCLGVKARVVDCSPFSTHGTFEKSDIDQVLTKRLSDAARPKATDGVSLVTSFYLNAPIEELEKNVSFAVKNASCSGFEIVSVLFEGNVESLLEMVSSELSGRVNELRSIGRLNFIEIRERPSYWDLFSHAKELKRPVAIVVNSDILFDAELLKEVASSYRSGSRPLVALTRWNETKNGLFIQGVSANPPWAEVPLDKLTYREQNFLSYDAYIFDVSGQIPAELSDVKIGTFNCDTAVCAIWRVSGAQVVNPCLRYKIRHIDQKERSYKDAAGQEQSLQNTEAFRKSLLTAVSNRAILSDSLSRLELLRANVASIGTPNIRLGAWHSLLRLFGATPWSEEIRFFPVVFRKFSLSPVVISQSAQRIFEDISTAISEKAFVEIEINGCPPTDHFLEVFGRVPVLRELREQLYRYNWQSVLFVDYATDEERGIHSDTLLLVRRWLTLGAGIAGNVSSTFDWLTDFPRLLMIDCTPVGHTSATGQLKQTFLGNWPESHFLQIWELGGANSTLRTISLSQSIEQSRATEISFKHAIELCRAFQPDVIYFRPVDSEVLFDAAEQILNEINKPLVIHMMDDWPERLRSSDSKKFQKLDGALRRFLSRASQRFSICQAMSDAYQVRYGSDWLPLANGADLAEFPAKDWSKRPPISRQYPFVIRYMGALADDMTYSSVREFATAVSSLQAACAVRLEIYTMEWCRSKAEQEIGKLPGISVLPLVEDERYKQSLTAADALVIAYNFDIKSISYIGLSLANKMPECLASGTPVIAYGPLDVATIRYLKESGCAQVVDKCDQGLLIAAIRALVEDTNLCQHLGEQARAHVAEKLSKRVVQKKFKDYLSECTRGSRAMPAAVVGPFTRDRHAHYDETDCISELIKDGLHGGQVMIDVGAHHGWAHASFLDRDWRIFAFEPDNQNRSKLLERLSKYKNNHLVTVDARCVSNNSQKGVSFFTSEMSTGISGLSAFHETHIEAQKVDTTTLTEFFQDKLMPAVDFLKIDTEGHDLFVLQGFPWDRGKPLVIECEFEDIKTVPLGYSFHDLANYLVDKGYIVYVSEWHPIIRYGIRHDWNRLVRYPCELADSKGWGNLIAFRTPINESDLVTAVRKFLKVCAAETAKAAAPVPQVPTSRAVDRTVTQTMQLAKATSLDFCFEPSRFFIPVGSNQWLYTHSDETQRLLMAVFPAPRQTNSRGFVGGLRLQADRPMTVNVTLGRHGKTVWEGNAKKIKLSPGVVQSVKLSTEFTMAHDQLKIQVEVLELVDGDISLLTIDALHVNESLASIRRRVGETSLTLREANRLYRERDFSTAMGIYLLLHRQRPLQIYPDNALMAARKLSMMSVATVEDLLQRVEG